jgi:hypothetical protein
MCRQWIVATIPFMRDTSSSWHPRAGVHALVLLAVIALHLLAVRDFAWPRRTGEPRMDAPVPVLFARLVPHPPPPVAPAPPDVANRAPPDRHASQRRPAPSADREVRPPALAGDLVPVPSTGSPVIETAAPAATEPAPTMMPAFEWPPSMRLSYAVHVKDGPRELAGSATLVWQHDGDHYRIDLCLDPGMPFIFHLQSEGAATRDGLLPQRLASERRGFSGVAGPETGSLQIDDGGIVLTDGRRVARPEGVQDLAAVIFEMARTFALHPQWLQEGRSIDMPLATLAQVSRGVLDVGKAAPVDTGLGMQQAVALRWRASPGWAGGRPADAWIAPTLGYLPARMAWQLSDVTRIDMTLSPSP